MEMIKSLQRRGFNQTQIASDLGTRRESVRNFCQRYGIKGWNQGAQLGNTNGMTCNGMGRNTIRRLTARIMSSAGKDLHKCERCGWTNPFENLPRHHKDRDRSNNDLNNLEILCHTCHGLEHLRDRERNEEGQFS